MNSSKKLRKLPRQIAQLPPEKNHACLFGREVLDQLIEFGGVLVEHHVVATFFFFKDFNPGSFDHAGFPLHRLPTHQTGFGTNKQSGHIDAGNDVAPIVGGMVIQQGCGMLAWEFLVLLNGPLDFIA